MALQFNPPEWLIRDYMNRKQPAEIMNEGVGNAINTYATLKKQQGEQAIRDRQMKLLEQKQAMDGRENFYKYGDVSTLPPEAQSAMNNPMQGPPTEQGDLPGGGNHIVDAFEQFRRQFPQGIEGEKAMRERNGLNKPNVGIPQYSALQSGKPEDLSQVFPEGIPNDLAKSALASQSRNVRVTQDPFGNPIRVPVGGGLATPIEYPKDKLNPLQAKLNPNEYKDWSKEVNDFDADPVVKTDRAALGMLNQIETELGNYNKSMTGPLKSQQARVIAREVAALTDSDIARQALDPSVVGRLKSWVSVAATGEIPDDQLNLLRDTVKTIKGSASSRISSVARERATRKSNQYGGRISPDELLGSLNLPTNFSVSQGGAKGDPLGIR